MRWTGWAGLMLIACGGGPLEVEDVKIGRWVVRKCEPRSSESPPAPTGNWGGELTFQQTRGEDVSSQLVEAELPGSETQGLAPADAILSLGFFGGWRVYDSGPPPLDLTGMWAEGAEKTTLYAYYTGEEDGPANPLRVTEGEICESESSFEWQATVEYPWVDLVDYTTYAYTAFDTPVVTLEIHEVLVVEDDELVIASIAEGELEDGTPIALQTSGRLSR